MAGTCRATRGAKYESEESMESGVNTGFVSSQSAQSMAVTSKPT